MSLFNAYKKEVGNKDEPEKSKKGRRATRIDVEALEGLKARLSIFHTNNQLAETTSEKVTPTEHREDIEVKGHRSNTEVTGTGRYGNVKVTPTGHGRNVKVTPTGQDTEVTGTVTGTGKNKAIKNNLKSVPLTVNQMKVYSWFVSNGMTGYFNKEIISQSTGIIHNTVRKIIRKLASEKLILFGEYNNGIKKIPYTVSNSVSVDKVTPTGHGQGQDTEVTGQGLISSSSSFLNLKTTTAKFFEHPESEFWKEQGITPEIFDRNVQEHGFDPEVLIMSAKHYAFEYSQPGKTPPERSHLIHLIGGIRKFGLWDRPSTYISYEKRLSEQIRAFREIHEKEIEELEAEQNENAFVAWYKNFLETPDSEEVKAVMDQASSFDLDNLRKKPDKKEAWLRTIWNKSRNMN